MTHKALPVFGGWAGPRNPKLLIVGEAWGENENQVHQPFVGASGMLLWEMLGQALPDLEPEWHASSLFEGYRYGPAWVRGRVKWLEAAGIAYTNVLNLQPMGNRMESLSCSKADLPSGYPYPGIVPAKGLYLKPDYLPELDRLLEEIRISRPNCILAAGNTACWALLQATNIGAIRGAATLSVTEPHTKLIPAYHPAAILRQWKWYPITVADIAKALRESLFPSLVRPERFVIINPELQDIFSWWVEAKNASMLAVDIETKWQMISCIGFGASKSDALVIPFTDLSKPGFNYWPTHSTELSAWMITKTILESPIPKLFQNGMYDLQYIVKMGIRPRNVMHDTMLLHHSLYPEMLKGLGFLGSIYTNEAAWKLMGRPKADTVKRDE